MSKWESEIVDKLRRSFWLAVLAVHGVVAAAWWWLMPGGFPINHPRFWVNCVFPPIMLAGVIAARVAAWKRRPVVLKMFLVGLVGFWSAAAISARFVFPVSMRYFWLLVLLAAVALGASLYGPAKDRALKWTRVVLVTIPLVLLGFWLPFTQRAPMPDTRPLNITAGQSGGIAPFEFSSILLSDEVRVQEESVSCSMRHLNISVWPLLTFHSRSPDGCWVLMAPPRLRAGVERKLSGLTRIGDGIEICYEDDDHSSLHAAVDRSSGVVEIEAISSLREAVYSHLNTYCELAIAGHRRLFLAFSPCPETRVEVVPFDYPFGRPRRLAYLDAARVFHVVEAHSGEKGPFRELAGGPLGRQETLGITLFDEDRAVGRVVLEDFASQAAMALSPTAGWGLPMNAIEFSLSGEDPGSLASVFVTLAGTSVGRGFDSVGHAPGTYRNRMRIEPIRAYPAEVKSPLHQGGEPVATQGHQDDSVERGRR